MNAEQLKASILQQAIEGKLVPQLDSEGSVEQIGDAPEEVPFAIPEKWKWFTLGSVIEYGKCNQLAGNEITSETWVLDLEDIEKNTGRILEKKRGVSTTSNKNKFEEGFVLYSKLRPYLNKVVIADESGVCTTEIVPINVASAKVPLLARYLQCYLMSPLFLNHANQASYGVKMPRLGTKDARAALIPIPPVEEQSRIVTRIEELLPLVEAYGKSYDRLQELNAELPGKLKASILQEAIQGKLVPQLDSEEAVEQIGDAPNEVPFTIPEKWKWVKIKSVFTMQAGKFISASSIRTEGKVPCYGGNGLRGYVDEANRNGHFPLIGRQGALCGNVHVVNGEFYATEHAVVVDCGTYGDPECVGLFLKAMNLNQYATATAQPGLSVKKIVELPFPLPPKSEQVRIASKVKELMKQVEALSGLEITS